MIERPLLNVQRDCPARLVPIGTGIMIPKDSFVTLVQSLGGSYTVLIEGNMARIDGEDADAIGFEPQILEYGPADPAGTINMEDVEHTLRSVHDPEIPVNIVDLGLIYRCVAEPREQGHALVVDLTLTAPGCGMGPVIVEDIRRRLRKVPNVAAVEVNLVFDPPWHQNMMSEEAQLELGIFGLSR